MRIRDYTVPELNRFRQYCNFTESERAVFDVLSDTELPIETCAEMVHMSSATFYRRKKQVENKISRV